MDGYDVIGDVHGHADALVQLLKKLGYTESAGAYRHATRTAIFVGDLIDRGPAQLATLDIVRRMTDAGSARMVLGNHEFNALAWATPNDDGEWCRPHTAKNLHQHQAFLAEVPDDSSLHHEWVQWFSTQPLWLDLPGLRVVHACWHADSMTVLGDATVTRDMVVATTGDPLFDAVEVVLKGPEVDLGGIGYKDADGHCRHRARIKWWDPAAATVADAALIPGGATSCDGTALGPLPTTALDFNTVEQDDDRAVLYGHYWRSGEVPRTDGTRTACLDWSIAKGGQLVAYRWSGERDLTDANLVAVR